MADGAMGMLEGTTAECVLYRRHNSSSSSSTRLSKQHSGNNQQQVSLQPLDHNKSARVQQQQQHLLSQYELYKMGMALEYRTASSQQKFWLKQHHHQD
jgi:hypothetical protein